MKTISLKTIMLLLLTTAFPTAVLADSATGTFPTDQPIETKMDLGFLGLFDSGMKYAVGGKPISRYEDFKNLIYPLRDQEASDLIRESEEYHYTAWIFYVAGAATGVEIGLNFPPVKFIGVNWVDRIATGVAVTGLVWRGGTLFDQGADGRKFNAVQRYNQLIRQKNQAFLELKPEISLAADGPRLGLSCGF